MASFLQSVEWERFQEFVGRSTRRIGGALVIRHDLPGGLHYLYCSRPDGLPATFFNETAVFARKERAVFLKIEPQKNFQFPISNFQCKESNSLQPQKTVILDLMKSEDELLRAMHEKTRYNIRLAERRGVQIRNSKLETRNECEVFYSLLKETAERDMFHTHEKAYYEKLLQTHSDVFSNELFFAEYKGQALATALVNFYGGTATYLHGASSREHREVMAPHLLHWRVIQEARRRGFVRYDLWGIDEKKWPGITRFKTGFGGRVVEYSHAFDIVYRPMWYRTYFLVRKVW